MQVELFGSDPGGPSHVKFAFRGAYFVPTYALTGGTEAMDAYGDTYPPTAQNTAADQNSGISFTGNDDSWHDSIGELDGARYLQVRVSVLTEPNRELILELTGLAFAWRH